MAARRRSGRSNAGRRSRGEDAAGAECVLRLDRLASGGDAVGTRDDGKTVFVEDGVPGDRVRVRITEERRRFARARIEALIEPSPVRVKPRCPHFGRCGGCSWQHVAYEAQLEAKARILADALERIGGFTLEATPSMTASTDAYGYRGRARVRIESGRVGLLERRSHRLCAIEACPVLAPALEGAVLALAQAYEDGEWSVCIGADGAVSVAQSPVDRERASSSPSSRPSPIELELDGARLALDAGAFSQANRLLHQQLAERVRHVLFEGASGAARRAWNVLELHAGIGFFTRGVAEAVGHLVAVEADPVACRWLAHNVGRAGSVEVVSGTFAEVASRLDARRFDAVLLDPPRTGLSPAELAALARLAPSRIVYLSCDPATLARDARGLAEATGYVLTHVEGFDLFPHTPHTEGLIRLELGGRVGTRDVESRT